MLSDCIEAQGSLASISSWPKMWHLEIRKLQISELQIAKCSKSIRQKRLMGELPYSSHIYFHSIIIYILEFEANICNDDYPLLIAFPSLLALSVPCCICRLYLVSSIWKQDISCNFQFSLRFRAVCR